MNTITIEEIIPLVKPLPQRDKFKLMQFILDQLTEEEEKNLPVSSLKQQDSLWNIIGMAEGENTNVAQRHDEYLYGVK
jgi:hypothetical protein